MKCCNLKALLVFFSAILLFSCKKGMDTNVPPPVETPGFGIPAATPVTGRITGIVVNENNLPVQNADVSLAAYTVQTDANGFFEFNNAVLDKYVTTVTVNKTGYFKALRSFSATASRNYVSIKLIPRSLTGTFSAAAGGIVNLPNGTGITFQSEGIIVKGTGTAYTGPVNVYAAYIDPTASDFATRVPGSMMGRDDENMFVLQSTGMIAVDLESAGGQALQLASNKPAALKMPIPASLLSKAPSTIDTWSLDDRGVWVKEATATRNGAYYETQLSHFSFWNLDVPANAVYLTLNIHDQNGNPLSNTFVQLTIPNSNTWWTTTHGFTDSAGTVAGLVPANLGLVMTISPNPYTCSNPVYSQNIGPFSSDTTLNITITLNSTQQVTITGTLNDCNGQPVDSGTAAILAGPYNYYYTSVVNGQYSFTVPYCSTISAATIWLSDSNTGASTGPVNISISGNTVTVPAQSACSTVPDAVFNYNGCQVLGSYVAGQPLGGNNYIMTVVNVLVPGNYNIVSNAANGIVFSGSGSLTHVGLDTIYLQGSGMPATNGQIAYTISGGGQGCSVMITFGTNSAPAVFTISGAGGGCSGINVVGNYVVNFPLNQTNWVSITVNVISGGSYYISTNTANGMTFADSGVFINPGVQSLVLNAYGTPLAANTSTFTLQANGAPGCSFDVTATNTGSAVYTFDGAPGTCPAVTIGGTYQAGVPLIGQNTASIQLNVTSIGAYSIMTNTVNGITFSASGIISVTGPYTVLLTASGTPQAAGVNTFTLTGGSSQGCVFTVTTN